MGCLPLNSLMLDFATSHCDWTIFDISHRCLDIFSVIRMIDSEENTGCKQLLFSCLCTAPDNNILSSPLSNPIIKYKHNIYGHIWPIYHYHSYCHIFSTIRGIDEITNHDYHDTGSNDNIISVYLFIIIIIIIIITLSSSSSHFITIHDTSSHFIIIYWKTHRHACKVNNQSDVITYQSIWFYLYVSWHTSTIAIICYPFLCIKAY